VDNKIGQTKETH